jgi:hypothetical protein
VSKKSNSWRNEYGATKISKLRKRCTPFFAALKDMKIFQVFPSSFSYVIHYSIRFGMKREAIDWGIEEVVGLSSCPRHGAVEITYLLKCGHF